jgi:hypothetical protein
MFHPAGLGTVRVPSIYNVSSSRIGKGQGISRIGRDLVGLATFRRIAKREQDLGVSEVPKPGSHSMRQK